QPEDGKPDELVGLVGSEMCIRDSFVDSAGNPIFDNGKDPAIEMNGKIYDGEWQVKGNVISETYGAPPTTWNTNYQSKSEFALYNKASYDFLVAQIQTYYK
ncbi:hypothetical protein ACN6QF_21770, partial [Acinetobacter baumannii]